jgi:hypothetical protein
MQQTHFYFLIKTQLQDSTSYLVNNKVGYIPNLFTQIASEYTTLKATKCINELVEIQREKIKLIHCQDGERTTYILACVTLDSARKPKLEGFDWVGKDFVLEEIVSEMEGREKELLLAQLNSQTSSSG